MKSISKIILVCFLFIFFVIVASFSFTSKKIDNTASLFSIIKSFFSSDVSDKEIVSYMFRKPIPVRGKIDEVRKNIFLEVPVNVKRSDLISNIIVSGGAVVSPSSGESVNFLKQPVVYTVTADDQTTQTYNVYVFGTTSVPLPTPISTCQQLQDIGKSTTGNYLLVNDIDCSDTVNWNNGGGFIPIGSTISNPTDAFKGNLDGNGYVIRNLYMKAFQSKNIKGKWVYGSDYVGIFGAMQGTISNLKVENATITREEDYYYTPRAGGLVGFLLKEGKIINSSFSGTVNLFRTSPMGGLVGINYGTIENSYFTGSVYINDYDDRRFPSGMGGFVGENRGTITNSYANSTLNAVNSYNQGRYSKVGGFVGINPGTIRDSYAAVKITSAFPETGCFVGYNYGNSVLDWRSTATVNATGTTANSYCDIEKANFQSTTYGGTGTTTAAMKATSTFSGWDFDSIWNIDSEKNGGYVGLVDRYFLNY